MTGKNDCAEAMNAGKRFRLQSIEHKADRAGIGEPCHRPAETRENARGLSPYNWASPIKSFFSRLSENGGRHADRLAPQLEVNVAKRTRELHRPSKAKSGGSIFRSKALAVFAKPRTQSSVLNRSIVMSNIMASAAGTPPADQAFRSVRVAA